MEHSELFALITRAKAGDRDAFRALYEATSDRVFRFLLGQVGGRENALDLLQDTYIDLWKGLLRFVYQSDEAYWGFLFLIARRKVFRHRGVHTPTPVDQDTLEFLHESENPHLPPEWDTEYLSGAILQLSSLSKEIINLRYWSELSFKEIAIALSVTENTAKVRHHRALRELRAYLPAHAKEQFITN